MSDFELLTVTICRSLNTPASVNTFEAKQTARLILSRVCVMLLPFDSPSAEVNSNGCKMPQTLIHVCVHDVERRSVPHCSVVIASGYLNNGGTCVPIDHTNTEEFKISLSQRVRPCLTLTQLPVIG